MKVTQMSALSDSVNFLTSQFEVSTSAISLLNARLGFRENLHSCSDLYSNVTQESVLENNCSTSEPLTQILLSETTQNKGRMHNVEYKEQPNKTTSVNK